MSGRIPDSIINEIQRRSDIIEIIGSYVQLTRKGDRWWGLCPFHSEKTPSFAVSHENNLFYCFGCGKGGNLVGFLMDIESLSFPETLGHLADKAGIEIHSSSEDESLTGHRKALEDLYIRISKTFQWLLYHHPQAEDARNHLKHRGINRNTCEIFRLGWAPSDGEWLYKLLLKKKYSPQFLATSGLFSRKSPSWAFFVDRLMFPVMPDLERVIAFSGRDLKDKGPKYKNSPDTTLYKKSQHLYGLGQAKKNIRNTKRVLLCEGNLDVLACYQSGLKETVAPLGTSLTKDQVRTLKRFVQTVVLMFDGDRAGVEGTRRAALILEEQGLTTQAVHMRSGTDPADIIQAEGEKILKEIASNPLTVFDFLLHYGVDAKSNTTGEKQEEALAELIPYLSAIGSEVRREAYLRQFADAMNVDPHAVIREFHNRSKQQKSNQGRIAENSISDELYLLIAVALNPEFFVMLKTMLAPEVFRDKRALSIYRLMDEMSVNGTDPSIDSIVKKLDDHKLKELLIEKSMTEEFAEKIEETISEKIDSLRIRTLLEERRELSNTLSNVPDSEQAKACMQRINEIDKNTTRIRQGEND